MLCNVSTAKKKKKDIILDYIWYISEVGVVVVAADQGLALDHGQGVGQEVGQEAVAEVGVEVGVGEREVMKKEHPRNAKIALMTRKMRKMMT